MKRSRREFVATSMAGIAGLCTARSVEAGIGPAQAAPPPLPAEDGYRLWLRYSPPGSVAESYRTILRQIVVQGTSETSAIIRTELSSALTTLAGAAPSAAADVGASALVVGTPSNSPIVRALGLQSELAKLGAEGYLIRTTRVAKHPVIAIASSGEIGALYGAFHFLRLLQTAQPIDRLNIAERPRVQLRMLNHWDNMNGTIERGYAGRSLWQWADLPDKIDPRYADYARANASIGINGAVVEQRQRRHPRSSRPNTSRRLRRWRRSGGRTASACISPRTSRLPCASGASRPRTRWTRTSWPGGRRRSTRSTRSFRTSAASSSRPTPRGSRGRRITAAATPRARTCSPTRSRRTAAT